MKTFFVSLVIFLISTSLTTIVTANEAAAGTATESTTYKALSWNEVLQKKYGVTSDQMKTLDDKKFSNSNKTMFLHIMKTSNKSFDEVLTASQDGKKDFGKLSKELGVPPQQLGQSVKDVTKEYTAELQKERKEKQAAHKAKSEAEQKVRDEKAALERKEREERKAAEKKARDEKRTAEEQARKEKQAALKKERDEKAAALKKEREEKAAALKKAREEKRLALKAEQEEKRKALKAEREARNAEKAKLAAERKAQRTQNAKKPEAPKN